jgi:hypothetical protein
MFNTTPTHLDVLVGELVLHGHLVAVGALGAAVALALDKKGADARLVALRGAVRE